MAEKTGRRPHPTTLWRLALIVIALAAVGSLPDRSADSPPPPGAGPVTTRPPFEQVSEPPFRTLREVDWSDFTVPGSACGTAQSIRLSNGYAYFDVNEGAPVRSVSLDDATIEYGNLNGDSIEEAAVPLTCSGRTSRNSLVVYRLRNGVAELIGVVTTTQPDPSEFSWPFIDNRQTRFENGRLTVKELWYDAGADDFCCPSTVATTTWRYDGQTLSSPSTSTAPRTVDRVRPEDFIGHWRVHGGSLDIVFGGHGMASSAYGGACAPDADRCYERMALKIVPSADEQSLIATIIEVAYYTDDGSRGTTPPDATPEIGDQFRLEFVYPGLIKSTTIHTADPTRPNALGNPYLCADDVDYEVAFACGA